MQTPVYNIAGEIVSNIDISDYIFDVPFSEPVVHQAMVAQLANNRHGTSSTKTRGEVAGSTKKLFAQKHTGNARAGSIKSPLRRGGGIVFGPKPRDYRQAFPKKMRRLALRCVLSDKVREKEFVALEQLKLDGPKTKDMIKILSALSAGSSTLVVTLEPEENVIKSARNLPGVKTLPASVLNVVDILSHKKILITVDAVRKVEELWGKESSKGESNAAS